MSSNRQELPLEAVTTTSTDKPACFVIMPISDPDGYTPGHFKRVFEDIFKPACEKAGFAAVLASQVRQTNLIHLDILQKLLEAPMALCDLSSRNPNVLFELGLRQAFDKPVALVREEGTLDIFDIAPLRYTSYRKERIYNEVLEDQEGIAHAIKDTYEACQHNEGINSLVRLLSLRPAALEDIRGAEKESALLQVIMAELSSLRSEIREIKHQRPSLGLLESISTPSKPDSKHSIQELQASIEALKQRLGETERDYPSVSSGAILRRFREVNRMFEILKNNVPDDDIDDFLYLESLEEEIKGLEHRVHRLSRKTDTGN